MSDFINQIQSDELTAAQDWAEYQAYLDGELEQERIDAANRELQEVAAEATHDEDGNYIWSDEAIEWEEGFHPDNLYDDEDDDDYDDHQPTMYEEYQDLYGGDDWDHGQYDDYGDW